MQQALVETAVCQLYENLGLVIITTVRHELEHLRNVEKRFYCPQTFLSLTFQCRDDVCELKQTLRDRKARKNSYQLQSRPAGLHRCANKYGRCR